MESFQLSFQLPIEIIYYIFTYVDLRDLLTLTKVCLQFRKILQFYPFIWKTKKIDVANHNFNITQYIEACIARLKNPKPEYWNEYIPFNREFMAEVTVRPMQNPITLDSIIMSWKDVSSCTIKIDIETGVEFHIEWEKPFYGTFILKIARRYADINLHSFIQYGSVQVTLESKSVVRILDRYMNENGFLELFFNMSEFGIAFTHGIKVRSTDLLVLGDCNCMWNKLT